VIVGGGVRRLSMAHPQSTLLRTEDAFQAASGSSPSPSPTMAHSHLTWRAVVGTTAASPSIHPARGE